MTQGLFKTLVILACACFLGFAFWQVDLLQGQSEPGSAGTNALSSRKSSLQERPPASPANPAAEQTPPGPSTPALKWQALETEDYREYLANLRAIGCPEQTIQDIVAADLLSAYAERRRAALAERFRNFKYWRADPNDQAARDELERQRRQIDQEMGWAMRELLGQEYLPPSASQSWRAAELEAKLEFLPVEKRTQVRNLLVELTAVDEKMQTLASSTYRAGTVPDPQQVMADYDAKRLELQQLLSPAEAHLVEMTTYGTAENLRQRLTQFAPTESEFQILFQEMQEYDYTLARMSAAGEADPRPLQELLRSALTKRLGHNRAEEFWESWSP